MALSVNTTHDGIDVQGAYVKIEHVNVTKDSVTAAVVWRANASSAPLRHKAFSFAYDLAGENPIKQAYHGLKTLPEFAGAADV